MNKIITIKDENKQSDKKPELSLLVDKKIVFFKDIMQKTIIHVQKNKNLDILGVSEVNTCIQLLNHISDKIQNLLNKIDVSVEDSVIADLQIINNELSGLFKTYGTESFDDLLTICFGSTQTIMKEELNKYEILKKYFHPTSYKVVKYNDDSDSSKKKVHHDEVFNEKMKHLDCHDISLNVKPFHMKVYGIKLYLEQPIQKKRLIVYGILDDVFLKFLHNSHISDLTKSITEFLPADISDNAKAFEEFFNSLSLKDFIIYNHTEIYQKFFGIVSQFKLYKQKSLNIIVKEFIQMDLYTKRNTIMNLLINSNNYENKYIAYLLYDLLSNDINGAIDTVEQTILFDSLPFSIKDLFRDAMKKTVQYTNELSNFDINKIPLEQQICLMKASEVVKEKAMIKLKEIKSKSDDSGSKARQYLDGLLKIPFQIYKRERIMHVMEEIKLVFKKMVPDKEKYTGAEILKFVYSNKHSEIINENSDDITKLLKMMNRTKMVDIIKSINIFIGKNKNSVVLQKINFSKLKINELVHEIMVQYQTGPQDLKNVILHELTGKNNIDYEPISKKFDQITDYISNVKTTLDDAIHGHDNAKKQMERIIGQWINGEQDGYCFGFEGPPGVGKTSLAKRGLSQCLKDEFGEGRPFAMIQMGGDSNGSTLHGHNYTYVGSTWGSIVQILIDKKCMNPIIFIDELDKISRTEHGREIIGILTHLLDPTQNDSFQDKYFSGIDLDLSKALFILSYNDVDSIDKILLDRIHRIKFSSLSLEDKLQIVKLHMLPEIYKKMGMEGLVTFSQSVLTTIIEEYTSEPGVRKLREILFEIIGEINLDILKNKNIDYIFPIDITISDIKAKYFNDKRQIKIQKIPETSSIGIINGLWANSLGNGGVIPIQARFFPCDKFLDLKLTGMQGDVMKESMNVALTLAWTITSHERKGEINEMYNQQHVSKCGVHIHCPEGSVPKDGPSAGTAITTVIYSILNNKKIKHNFAITGEISLDGRVTEIGGLDLKIIGGIKAGVKEFIFPKENQKDFDKFMDKYGESELVKEIIFHSVEDISEVFEMIFE